ncbi:unnamed protein product [Urochloa humidicola]
MAPRMAAVALRMATLKIMIVAWMIVEWPRMMAMMNCANVNHAKVSGLANVRCNCWPFVQTSLSVKSTALTSTKVGASMCSVRGKSKRKEWSSWSPLNPVKFPWLVVTSS